jgi:hypothetical protein
MQNGMPEQGRFSERIGVKPVKTEIQTTSMDSELRNSLWNVLTIHCWNKLDKPMQTESFSYDRRTRADVFFRSVWLHFLKLPLDNIPFDDRQTLQVLRQKFFEGQWYEVYEFTEFTVGSFPRKAEEQEAFVKSLNWVLARELSGYRFVGGILTRITSCEEIASIEDALKLTDKFGPVRDHTQRSLELLSDRKEPDYRNSIKESISAIEALCKLTTGLEKATLDDALGKLGASINLHPALMKAFSNLYGYTSDAEGIRHALLEESSLDFDDAKFMLVCCSAFVNFVISKLPA